MPKEVPVQFAWNHLLHGSNRTSESLFLWLALEFYVHSYTRLTKLMIAQINPLFWEDGHRTIYARIFSSQAVVYSLHYCFHAVNKFNPSQTNWTLLWCNGLCASETLRGIRKCVQCPSQDLSCKAGQWLRSDENKPLILLIEPSNTHGTVFHNTVQFVKMNSWPSSNCS